MSRPGAATILTQADLQAIEPNLNWLAPSSTVAPTATSALAKNNDNIDAIMKNGKEPPPPPAKPCRISAAGCASAGGRKVERVAPG